MKCVWKALETSSKWTLSGDFYGQTDFYQWFFLEAISELSKFEEDFFKTKNYGIQFLVMLSSP